MHPTPGTAIGLLATLFTLLVATPVVQAQFRPPNMGGIPAKVIADAIRTNVRLALRAQLVIKPGQKIEVNGVAVDGSGRYLATALGDGSTRVWDTSMGREIQHLGRLGGGATALVVSRAGDLVASGGGGGDIQVWRLPGGESLARKRLHRGRVNALAIDQAGTRLASVGRDGAVVITGFPRLDDEKRLTFRTGVAASAVAIDHQTVIAGGGDGTIRIWDLGSGSLRRSFKAHDGAVNALALSQDAGRIVSGGQDGWVRVSRTGDGRSLRRFRPSGSAVRSVAMDPLGRHIAVAGDDPVVRLYNAENGSPIREYKGHTESVRSVTFGPKGRLLHSAGVDGTTRVWDLPKGRELAKVITAVDGWTVVDSDGRYDGSRGGEAAVQWQTSEGEFELEQFTEPYFQPGVLAEAMAGTGRRPAARAIPEGFPVPPTVNVSGQGDAGRIQVRITARDEGGGVSDIRLYQNGKRITADTPRVRLVNEQRDNDKAELVFETALLDGENRFRAVALSKERIESRPGELLVTHGGAGQGGVLHLVTVGINRYRNPALNLNYGVPDARGIRDYYRQRGLKVFREVRMYEFVDDEATADNLEEQLAALKDTRAEDVVVIYLAGHGETAADDWYFVPYELLYPNRPRDLKRQGVSSQTLMNAIAAIPAQRVMVLLDACKSGAALARFKGFEDRKPLRMLARLAGIHVMAATGKDQLATELSELGHGLFTYTLLEGLNGKADTEPRDGEVTVREVMDLSREWMPDLTRKYGTRLQFPVTDSLGQDFTVGAD